MKTKSENRRLHPLAQLNVKSSVVGGFLRKCAMRIVKTEQLYSETGAKKVKTDYSGMGPRTNPRHPIFRDHNCGGCDSGAKPCREGNYNSCSHPRARND